LSVHDALVADLSFSTPSAWTGTFQPITCCAASTPLSISRYPHHPGRALQPHGPPSINPELMIRMLLVGRLYGIRSDMRLAWNSACQHH
jgi:Transposase domain (DUF772)